MSILLKVTVLRDFKRITGPNSGGSRASYFCGLQSLKTPICYFGEKGGAHKHGLAPPVVLNNNDVF